MRIVTAVFVPTHTCNLHHFTIPPSPNNNNNNNRKGLVAPPNPNAGRVSLVAANPAACRDASESSERSCCRS